MQSNSESQIKWNNRFHIESKNLDNIKIIQSVTKKFTKYLDRETLQQCGLIALWETIKTYKPEREKFTSYLYNKVRWTCLDEMKKKSKKTYTLHSNIIDKDNLCIFNMVKELPDLNQQILIAKFKEKISLYQIAINMNLTYNQVLKIYHESLKKLRRDYATC